MKKILTGCSLCIAVLLAAPAFAQEKGKAKSSSKPKKETAANPEAMEKAWAAYMTPGDYHAMLAKDNGSWKQEITLWMQPGAPPSTNTATAVNSMVMGGRYQQSIVTGSFNGMPFEGISMTGYDNAKKVFTSTWVDNMGTGIMYLEGKMDPKTKILHLKGKTTDPITGKEIAIREEMKFPDENTRHITSYDVRDGKEFKIMEIKMTRL